LYKCHQNWHQARAARVWPPLRFRCCWWGGPRRRDRGERTGSDGTSSCVRPTRMRRRRVAAHTPLYTTRRRKMPLARGEIAQPPPSFSPCSSLALSGSRSLCPTFTAQLAFSKPRGIPQVWSQKEHRTRDRGGTTERKCCREIVSIIVHAGGCATGSSDG
jgi:hypothetical protein